MCVIADAVAATMTVTITAAPRISNNVLKVLVRFGSFWARTHLLSYCWTVHHISSVKYTFRWADVYAWLCESIRMWHWRLLFLLLALVFFCIRSIAFHSFRTLQLNENVAQAVLYMWDDADGGGGGVHGGWMAKAIGRKTNINVNKYISVSTCMHEWGLSVADGRTKEKRMKLFEFSTMVCHM